MDFSQYESDSRMRLLHPEREESFDDSRNKKKTEDEEFSLSSPKLYKFHEHEVIFCGFSGVTHFSNSLVLPSM